VVPLLLAVAWDTLKILGIVLALMVLVEYAEIRFGAGLQRLLRGRGLPQYGLAAALGAVPGCVDAFLVVSLYKAGLVSFGTLAAVMLATAGDEAFVMLAVIPQTAFLIFALCFLVGVAGGYGADWLARRLRLPLHPPCGAEIHPARQPRVDLRHFMREHIYGHILRRHLGPLVIWLFLTLLLLALADRYLDLRPLLPSNDVLLVIVAAIVGLVPGSGPHLVFLLLFADGLIPLSALVANSVSQDGHGVLPLLACAPRDAVLVKVYAAAVGLVVGLALLVLGL